MSRLTASITSKSNSIETQLGRIAASDVIRIEIVDGASLSIPGLSGPIVNVVVVNTGLSGQFEWHGQYNPELDYANFTRGSASVSPHGCATSAATADRSMIPWRSSFATPGMRQGSRTLLAPSSALTVYSIPPGNRRKPTVSGCRNFCASVGELR